jgi:hypothetical protein
MNHYCHPKKIIPTLVIDKINIYLLSNCVDIIIQPSLPPLNSTLVQKRTQCY